MNPISADLPKYWMNEEARETLRPVFDKLKRSENLDSRELAEVREYFKQWVDSPVWDRDPHLTPETWSRLSLLRAQVRGIKTTVDVWGCLHTMTVQGMDPL